MEISPYSLSHEWSLHWTRIPSNIKRSPFVNGESPKERKALEAIAAVGLIGGTQLTRIFSLDKKRLKRMVAEKKIVRNEIHRNKQVIPIYTLGINGAVVAGLDDGYISNYWVEYKVEDVLKRLLFFQLLKHFSNSEVLPTVTPFSGSIEFNMKIFHVYVVRGDVNELNLFLKWNEKKFNERLIIICESLRYIQKSLIHLRGLKVRVLLDVDLLEKNKIIQKAFYFLDENGQFVSEGGM